MHGFYHKLPIFPFIASALQAGGQPCECTWQQIATDGPSPRAGAAMAYDGAGQVLLVGGAISRTVANDETWRWDGDSWQQLNVTSPGPKSEATLTRLPSVDGLVLHGVTPPASSVDTWVFRDGDWEILGSGGPVRMGHGAAESRSTGSLVLTGGGPSAALAPNEETFALDNSSWSTVQSIGPGRKFRIGMVTDPETGEPLLFGGRTPSASASSTQWRWDPMESQWIQIEDSPTGPRFAHAMAASHEAVVVFGGKTSQSNTLGDTWIRRQGEWIEISGIGPSPREQAAMVYDEQREEFLLFGGLFRDDGQELFFNDTWALRCHNPCVADTNGDCQLNPTDFTAWIVAYALRESACDQNGDGLCNPSDFTAWIVNFNNGC